MTRETYLYNICYVSLCEPSSGHHALLATEDVVACLFIDGPHGVGLSTSGLTIPENHILDFKGL